MFDFDNLSVSQRINAVKVNTRRVWLLPMLCLVLCSVQLAFAQKPQAKVAQDMARWEKPPQTKQSNNKKTGTRKNPPAPQVVPAAPKKTTSQAKPATLRQVSKPKTKKALPKSDTVDDLAELPPVEKYGLTQHQKLFAVAFNGTQPNIEVRVDGESFGFLDEKLTLTIKLKPGAHTVTFLRNGFEQEDISIDVKATGKNNIPIPQLKPVVIIPRTPSEIATPTPTPSAIMAPPPATPLPTPLPTPVPVTNIGLNTVEVLRMLDTLLQRFKDPVKTNQITTQEWVEARQLIAPLLRRDGGNAELTARDYLAEGQLLFMEKNYFEARQKFREGVRVMPNFAILQYALGNTFLVSNEPNVAVEHFRAAVSQEQTFALAHKALADAFSKIGDIKNAQAEYLRARSLGFVSPEISASLGRNLMREPTWLQAITELSSAADKMPTAEIYLNLATCFDALKRPLSALEAYQSAISLEPNLAEPHYRLGELFFTLNEFRRAADAFEKYLIKAPDDPKSKRDSARQKANDARKRADSGK